MNVNEPVAILAIAKRLRRQSKTDILLTPHYLSENIDHSHGHRHSRSELPQIRDDELSTDNFFTHFRSASGARDADRCTEAQLQKRPLRPMGSWP
jgi:hypothetical protein